MPNNLMAHDPRGNESQSKCRINLMLCFFFFIFFELSQFVGRVTMAVAINQKVGVYISTGSFCARFHLLRRVCRTYNQIRGTGSRNGRATFARAVIDFKVNFCFRLRPIVYFIRATTIARIGNKGG